jgi:hypothetical protein
VLSRTTLPKSKKADGLYYIPQHPVEDHLIKADGKDGTRDGETDGHGGANSRFPNYFANLQNKTLLTKKKWE